MKFLLPAPLIPGPLLTRGQAQLVLTSEVDRFIEGVCSRRGSPGGASAAVVRLDPDANWNVETECGLMITQTLQMRPSSPLVQTQRFGRLHFLSMFYSD